MHFLPLSLYRLMKKRKERTDDSQHWIWRYYKMLQEDKRRISYLTYDVREGSLRAETCKMCKDDVGRRGKEGLFYRRTNKCKGLG